MLPLPMSVNLNWVSRQMNAPLKAGMTLAISQILLVDIDYVPSGERSVAAGAASALVLLVSWGIVALVYRTVADRRGIVPARGAE